MVTAVELSLEILAQSVLISRALSLLCGCMVFASRVLLEHSTRTLKGWLINSRKTSQNLAFYKLRTYLDESSKLSTIVQLIARPSRDDPLAKRLNELTRESCVEVVVKQSLRPVEHQRAATEGDSGRYEFEIQDLRVLNLASTDLLTWPQDAESLDNATRVQNRHLEMRVSSLGQTLVKRAELKTQLSAALEAQGFMEVETPLLFKSTSEGAREFLVPTRKKGQFFALPQSPQQYKQLLMAGGVRRYYQFARCFRDETARTDRQLEFTQLDLEMAWVNMDDVMYAISKTVLSVDRGKSFQTQFGSIRRMKYHDAMSQYGSDKPDLRFDFRILNVIRSDTGADLPDSVDILPFKLDDSRQLSNMEFSALQRLLRDHQIFVIRTTGQKVPPQFQDVARQILSGLEPLKLICRRPQRLSGGATAMGQARLLLQSFLEDHRLVKERATRPFELCWITDFPLFSPETEGEPGQGGNLGISSTHHPFTAPHPDDVHLLDGSMDDLMNIRGLHYDLVMNGVEIGGGSIRIHNAALQRKIFTTLGMASDRIAQFDHLLRVLDSGCPPHGGFALGFDRFVALWCGQSSIRDVIAFPKTSRGTDPFVGSPSSVDNDTLREYHIQLS